jgi:hypothetical protein
MHLLTFILSEPQAQQQQVPEPASLPLLFVGASGLGVWRARKARRNTRT